MACSKWTPEDIEFLIKNNSKYTSTQLAALMGRNQRAIETKRIRLKLKANEKVTNEAKRVAKLKEKNPNWKGNQVCKDRGRERARSWIKVTPPCEVCGSPKSERHHKDGNTLNNDLSNIAFFVS
jgi:hypothetical protein